MVQAIFFIQLTKQKRTQAGAIARFPALNIKRPFIRSVSTIRG